MYSTTHAREVTFAGYRRATLEQSLVTADWGLDARSPYISGPVLVAFVHDRFGREAFINVLRSDRPTFGSAMAGALGVSPTDFHREFLAWLAGSGRPEPRPATAPAAR